MNRLIEKGFRPIDSLSGSDDGKKWGLKQKLLLGLPAKEYFAQVLHNPFNWLLFVIFAVGLPVIVYRYYMGLGAVMHGSFDYPWGLFLGFGLFCMVPLSASGFLLGTTVELFGHEKYRPILNLALLNGLLGYLFAVVYLLVDLGCPWRLYYPMFVSWGTAAVLFLVGWHVATYLSVQVMEVSEAFFEWINWPTAKKFIHSGTLGLTVAGIILSTLHQGALGTLLCYAPGKVHPLWYSAEFMWIYYLCSSVFAGLCMVIAVSTIVKKTMAWRCGPEFLDNLDSITFGLAKGATMALLTYFVIKLIGVVHGNEWSYLSTGWGAWFLLEIGGGVVLPIILFSTAIRKNSVALVRFTAFLTIAGLLMNRLNTALITFNWNLYQEIPHPLETIITITIFALFVFVYRFILYRLPILYVWKAVPAEEVVTVPVPEPVASPVSGQPEPQYAKVVST